MWTIFYLQQRQRYKINGYILMIEIPLTQGQVALIDDEDFELVSKYVWYAQNCKGIWYARTNISSNNKKRSSILMHRLIITTQQLVDHKNGNGLDNRRENLRVCTKAQNKMNQKNKLPNASSKYKGVSKQKNFWKARITVDGQETYLGHFSSEVEAAKEYDRVAKKCFGEFASLNFSEEIYA